MTRTKKQLPPQLYRTQVSTSTVGSTSVLAHFRLPSIRLVLLLLLSALLQVVPGINALPQDILFDGAAQLEQEVSTAAGITAPSDLSTGLNLLPVSGLIAAAANVEQPAPIQFIRIAMNSGL